MLQNFWVLGLLEKLISCTNRILSILFYTMKTLTEQHVKEHLTNPKETYCIFTGIRQSPFSCSMSAIAES
jgi:hypothetical protein